MESVREPDRNERELARAARRQALYDSQSHGASLPAEPEPERRPTIPVGSLPYPDVTVSGCMGSGWDWLTHTLVIDPTEPRTAV